MKHWLNENNMFWSLFAASWFFIFNIVWYSFLENISNFAVLFVIFYFILEIKERKNKV